MLEWMRERLNERCSVQYSGLTGPGKGRGEQRRNIWNELGGLGERGGAPEHRPEGEPGGGKQGNRCCGEGLREPPGALRGHGQPPGPSEARGRAFCGPKPPGLAEARG